MLSANTLPSETTLVPELPTPSFVPIRYRPGNLGTWSGHLAFANDLIAALRPELLVELGTHWGESYFTFCQSVFQNAIPCLCYAVDNWVGEPHAGFYEEDVFQDVKQFNEAHYRAFSYLLRMTFDNAASQFSNDSIDLLHIDGLHTYDASSHDFHTWFPKVKPGGIILFHDIAVRHTDFGVWRLWDELRVQFANTFTFHHWWGLGILQKPDGAGVQPPLLDLLFKSSAATAEQVRRYYVMYTAYLEHLQTLHSEPHAAAPPNPKADKITQTFIQLFLHSETGYSEEASVAKIFPANQWQDVSLRLPMGTGTGRLRIDPADCVSIIEVRQVALRNESTGEVLVAASEPVDFKEWEFCDQVLVFEGSSPCSFVSSSNDPYFILPSKWQSTGPAVLEFSIRVQTETSAFADALKSMQARKEKPSLISDLERQLSETRSALDRERAARVSMERSKSWSLTKPLRVAAGLLKR